jgi:replication-associated recombination protein RarA
LWTSIVPRCEDWCGGCVSSLTCFSFFQTLGQLTFHPELTERLGKMVAAGDFPHLLFYGPSGAGKKTRVNAVLREVYGASVDKVKIEQRKVGRCH